MNTSNISNALLQELFPFRQFVVYRADKVPLRAADLQPASVTNPADWCDYDTASKRVGNDDVAGVGFVLTDADPFTCIDLDPSEDATVLNNHAEIFRSFNTYTEISPSGKGAHLWCKGTVSTRKYSAQHIEVYSTGRYMTVTSNAVSNVPVANRQELLNQLIQSIDAATERHSNAGSQFDAPQVCSDNDVADACRNAHTTLFNELWAGRWQGLYPSQSEADLALCNLIATQTNNRQQCGRIFRASALGQRDKAKRDSYLFDKGYGIVSKAFDQKSPVVEAQHYTTGVEDRELETRKYEQQLDETKQILATVPKAEFPVELQKHLVKLLRKTIGWKFDKMHVHTQLMPIATSAGLSEDEAVEIFRAAYRLAQKHPARPLAKGHSISIYDEYGNRLYGHLATAHKFITAYGDRLRYVPVQDNWYVFHDGVWEQDATLDNVYMAWQVVLQIAALEPVADKRHKLVSMSVARAMLTAAQSDRRIVATLEQWDKNQWLLAAGNVAIDLRTGQERDLLPDDYVTRQAIVAPVKALPERWLQFLKDVTGNNQELITYIQLLCGYCLTGSIRDEQFFFLYGTGRNGKTVFLNVLNMLFPDYTKFVPETLLMMQKHPGHRETLARLYGARIVMANEIPQGERWNTTLIKNMVAGTITANFMYQGSFDYRPTYKLIIAGNFKPVLTEFEEAMRRRLRLIPFNVTIPKEKCIHNLDMKLVSEEGGAILNWMIEGCLKWQSLKGGLDDLLPTVVKEATEEYFNSEDKVKQFLEANFDADPNSYVTFESVYFIYQQWAIGEEGMKVHNIFQRKTLIERIKSKGYQEKKTRHGKAFIGLKVKGGSESVQQLSQEWAGEVTSNVPFDEGAGIVR